MKRTAALVGANLGRLLLAATFLLSGGAKIIDPRGFINKLGDYTVALGIAQWTPGFVLTAVGIALAVAETVLGVYHLFGIRRRFTISITIATLAVMTALTVWLVLTGRLIDCGCFGDVWVMSNEQSLAKNVILLCISLCLAWKWRLVWKVVSVRWQWIVSLPAVAACIVVALWSFYTLPLIDLGPYKQGTDLRQALQSDDPRYADLYIEDTDGNDITEAWLSQDGPALLLVMPYVEKADEGKVNEINDLYEWAIEAGVPFLCLSASNPDGVEQWIDTTGAEYPFAWADDVLLKTMIRSNPGLILLSDGAVKGKWAHLNMPTNVELNDIQLND